MKSQRWFELKTAQYYLNYILAGFTMAERNQDGDIEWIGKDKNWTALMWLEDGVYENYPDKGEAIIKEFLATN